MLLDPALRIPLEALPVFPLPSTVLFPEQQLPLHIFEPRYRQMVRDALESAPFIVVALIEGDPNAEPTRVARVATAGRIAAHQRLSDGRFNILVDGAVRVAIEEVESRALYRRVRCTPMPEPADALDVPEHERGAMLSVLGMVMQFARKQTPSAEFKTPTDLDAGRLAFRVTDRVITDAAWRQKVLEADTALERVRRTTAALASLLSELPTQGARGTS
jgi:ATP-dependent Lon protease